MGLIPPVGMQGTQPIQQHPRIEHKNAVSTDVSAMLKEIGIHNIRSIRVQHGRHIADSLNEMAKLPLTHDQKNALNGLGLHGLLVAMFADEDDINSNYKDKLEELHEHLLGEETVSLLKEAFGLSHTPILLEDDNHNGLLLLQESIKHLENAIS